MPGLKLRIIIILLTNQQTRYNSADCPYNKKLSCLHLPEINNTQVDDAQDIDVIMPMYNLIKNSDAYSKTLGSLWQYYRDEPE